MATWGPPQPRRNVRKSKRSVKLYITSYTDEFDSERGYLSQEVLPELKSWCESKELSLKERFVKWGSRTPQTRHVDELEKTQTSIENCYHSSIMPIFINITCESVGWIPMWEEYPDEDVEDFLETYGLLVEDLEVMKAAYRQDNMNSLFLIRDDTFLCQIPEPDASYFLKKSTASEKLKFFGDKISEKIPAKRIVKYTATYCDVSRNTARKPQLNFSSSFKQTIIDFCKQRISFDFFGEQPRLSLSDDIPSKLEHLEYMKTKSEDVIGREDILKKIEDYIQIEDKDVPMLVLGEAGSGKSSIICKAASSIYNKVQDEEFPGPNGHRWNVFFHFTGSVPGSNCLESMLKRLLVEMEVLNDNNIPRGVDATAQMCCSLLSNPNTKPMILFIDALHQFADDQAARVMSWLPRKLAPQVRCIFSILTDSFQHTTLVNRETKPIEYVVPCLHLDSRKIIVKELLGKYGKTVSESQLEKIMTKDSSCNPLWLTVFCEELRPLENVNEIDNKIDSTPEGLLNLMDAVLKRFESSPDRDLSIATICLLEASSSGLLETELRQLLGNTTTLMPPSEFDEKEEKESSEKDICKQNLPLSDEMWNVVYSQLQPFLTPSGKTCQGRLNLYHQALHQAVKNRYFKQIEDEGGTGGEEDNYYWWHKMLASYFENSDNLDRYIEEYLYQLVCLEDRYRLSDCLCDWKVFDALYNEEYSSKLLEYWRRVGKATEMITMYDRALKKFEEDESVDEEAISIRYEKVCRVVIQAGKYQEALELLKTALKIEEKELGARPHRMVELYALMAEIYDEKLKLNDFVSPSQIPDLRMTIHYGKKSIALRKTLPGNYHKFKLGMSFMKLAFNMESWEACGGGSDLSGEQALEVGNKYIDKALEIFEELNDMGHYAEAQMTKGVLAPRGSMEQLKLYNTAKDLCMQMYGEYHILTSRLYINIGIVYEDNNDYKKAYEYFKKWARVSEQILGPDHPKTQRAKGVLRETRYRRIAKSLGELEDGDVLDNTEMDSNDDTDENPEEQDRDVENFQSTHSDLERYCEDGPGIDLNEGSTLNHSGSSASIGRDVSNDNNNSQATNLERCTEENSQALMNGYSSELTANSSSDNDSSEDVHDDQSELYAEDYVFNSVGDPVIDEFNVNLEDSDDDEIVQLATQELNIPNVEQLIENDNRYEDLREGHESSDQEGDAPVDSNRQLTGDRN
ncbi:TPR repeat-containing protein DDB_G0287407-like [Saccostrea echinata]|uniref:TPR repeat-containing protein DDB_G0287407-like n=1 Tax=Saccostrea echinata TaxID=191078 RepID=UPI002A83D065|nr:TPR repeat-containing protein DDB_G0287407-like [Saccostrea echinata]